MLQKIITESFFIAIITLVLGSITTRILIKDFEEWTESYFIEIAFFLTGIFVHLLLEFFCINDIYCSTQNK
tara:strand:+ start:171 stop:383 length:213 start_codon:yes stop_codon:yes gene_type:complete